MSEIKPGVICLIVGAVFNHQHVGRTCEAISRPYFDLNLDRTVVKIYAHWLPYPHRALIEHLRPINDPDNDMTEEYPAALEAAYRDSLGETV